MKKLALALLIAISAPAFAGTCDSGCSSGTQGSGAAATSTRQGQQQQTSVTSGSDSQATNNGNNQSIVFTSPSNSSTSATVTYQGGTKTEVVSSGTTTVRNVPSVNGPPLTSSNDTCMGSVSGSLNVAGFGGGFGSTYKDANCVMLKNSRELWNMGMRGAALARMCMDSENREALEITGFKCPQTEKAERDVAALEQKRTALATAGQKPEIVDPYVRKRMGLDDLDLNSLPPTAAGPAK